MYNWESIVDGVQLFYGFDPDASPNAVGTGIGTGSWQIGGANADLEAESPCFVLFTLYCPTGVSGSATVWIDSVAVIPPPPTCTASDEILMNGDFECDDAAYYPSTILGWGVLIKNPAASIQAITPGYGDSAQAVALSCGQSTRAYGLSAYFYQEDFTIPTAGTYQLIFNYNWVSVADGVQFAFGVGEAESDFSDPDSTGIWQTEVLPADMSAGEKPELTFELFCPPTGSGVSATIWIDSVSLSLMD